METSGLRREACDDGARDEAWLVPLAEAGVDIFHCSQRRFWETEFTGSDLNFAGWAKKLTGKPAITVGSVGLSGDFLAAFKGEASTPSSLDELLRRFDREILIWWRWAAPCSPTRGGRGNSRRAFLRTDRF